jgi:WD40 repeat protein
MKASRINSAGEDSSPSRFIVLIARFFQVFLGMCFLVGMLVTIEVVALWGMGVKYEPKQSIRKGGVGDFSLSADGRWGVSRLKLDRAGTLEQSLEVAICLHDLRHFTSPTRLNVGRDDIGRVAISPSGDHVVFATIGGQICISGRDHGSVPTRMLAKLDREVIANLSWSSDGQYLAAVGSQLIYVWAMPDGELLYTFTHGFPERPSISLSRDSRSLLLAGNDKLQLWNIARGTQVKPVFLKPESISGIVSTALSSNGAIAIVSSRDGGLFAWELVSGRELWRENSTRWRSPSIALSPDDSTVASIERRSMIGGWRDQVVVRSAFTGEYLCELDANVGHVAGLAFSSAGTLCVWGDLGWIVGLDLETRSELWRISSLDGVL